MNLKQQDEGDKSNPDTRDWTSLDNVSSYIGSMLTVEKHILHNACSSDPS